MTPAPNLDRFGGAEPEETTLSGHSCAYCDDDIAVGAEVYRTYEGEYVHDDCWRPYCDSTYREWSGNIGI